MSKSYYYASLLCLLTFLELLLPTPAWQLSAVNRHAFSVSTFQYVALPDTGRTCIWTYSPTDISVDDFYHCQEVIVEDSIYYFWHTPFVGYTYSFVGDTLSMVAYETEGSCHINIIPEPQYTTSLSYGDSLFCSLHVLGKSSENVIYSIEGSSSTVLDGMGTLVLGDDSIFGVSRTSTTRYYQSLDGVTTNVKWTIIRWYAKNRVFPILETNYIVMDTTLILSNSLLYNQEINNRRITSQTTLHDMENELNKMHQWSLNPNPARSYLKLTYESGFPSNGTAFISLFTLSGNLILSNQFSVLQGNSEIILPVDELSPGAYTLKLQYLDQTTVFIVIKQ